ncbi:MAG: chemotaxis protein CheB [Legionellaceae bacterium]|nr:chemotaxis protein CheB [Legionellaceae bacterium]
MPEVCQPAPHKNIHVKPYVVGIGASAGGLEAIEEFLKEMPLTESIAYVVIQHLDPTHVALLPELLQLVTPMKVYEAKNYMKVNVDCVYTIPCNKYLSILHDTLILMDQPESRGDRLAIDNFFISLANDQKERAVGILLSGMGSDGTVGLRAIKENAGLTIVQRPDKAKFDAMPQNAINSGLADIVAAASDIPKHLIDHIKHFSLGFHDENDHLLDFKSTNGFEQIVILLRERTNNDFSLYKKNTIYRRIERRMSVNQIHTLPIYVKYLQNNPDEIDLLFKELLIGVTSFFRDREVWSIFKSSALPTLLDKHPLNKVFRGWVPACSTGEEAYSLAIIFLELMADQEPQKRFTMQIFATDIDEDAIHFARQGIYPESIKNTLSKELLDRYFVKQENGYQVQKIVREMILFATQNIIMDPPFTKIDILSCRNLLIYLGPNLQKKLFPMFHYSLNNGGILFLGNAETTGEFTNLFDPLDKKSHIYFKIYADIPFFNIDLPQKLLPISTSIEKDNLGSLSTASKVFNLKSLADQVMLQEFSPSAVLTTKEGDILYINGSTSKYMEPASGKANWNIFVMARDGLRYEMSVAMRKAQEGLESVHLKGLIVNTFAGIKTLNLTVKVLTTPAPLKDLVMFVFHEVVTPIKSTKRKPGDANKVLIQELDKAREQIQTMREEMLNSQEALKVTNEELQTANEELQSTNEELTTSKEEMQSLNEELQTVNVELQSRVDDLSWVNNDMENLLNSTQIATVFLDNNLKVRRFTPHVCELFKLIETDIGRPLSDIVTNLNYENLQQDALKVLSSLVFIEKKVTTKDDHWFKVRIMPYRTHEYMINGIVITFTDITESKNLEERLRSQGDL